jgi:hypothetical protein
MNRTLLKHATMIKSKNSVYNWLNYINNMTNISAMDLHEYIFDVSYENCMSKYPLFVTYLYYDNN